MNRTPPENVQVLIVEDEGIVAKDLQVMLRQIGYEVPVTVPTDLVEKARVLDNFYIPTRYANGHPEGAPFEHYGPLQSDEAIRYAGEILEFVRIQMAQSRSG